ncbi:MAG: tetratricopeptide repeat protein [Kiritimatiellae bacterium]|nr:tetratricopeptide repeat protein [Kiritimatiellia bacterium]
MIDQSILYAACPCGSGEKFKFCCYPSIRDELPRDPSQADVTEAIRRRSQSARLAELKTKFGFLDMDRFHELIGLGLRYLHDEHFEEAQRVFLQAKNEFSMMPTAYNNLALCALIQGKLKEAEEYVQEAVRRFPGENPFGLAMYADIRYLKGDVIGALDLIGRAELIPPPSVDQAARVCESMAHFKDHERIIRYAEKSGYADAPEIAFFLGVALANLGREAEATQYLRIAVRGNQPDYTWRILGEVISGKRPQTICGDWMYFTPEFFTLFASLVNISKDGDKQQTDLSSEAIAELVEVETNAGIIDIAEAIKILSTTTSKRSERLLDALRSDVSRPESTRRAAEKAYAKRFANTDLGKKLRESPDGVFQQMIITEDAVTHDPLDPAYEESYFKAVRISLNPSSRKPKLKEALRLLEDLYAKVPDNPAVINNYASVLSRLGRTEEAMSLIRECFAHHPEYVFGAANYLMFLIGFGKMDEAKAMIENYRLPQRIHPDAYMSWLRILKMYYEEIGDEKLVQQVKDNMDFISEKFKR